MTVAMMGKTFDDFYESASELSAVHRARVTLNWESQKEMPPPFNLLSVPVELLGFVGVRQLQHAPDDKGIPRNFEQHYTRMER